MQTIIIGQEKASTVENISDQPEALPIHLRSHNHKHENVMADISRDTLCKCILANTSRAAHVYSRYID